MNSGGLKQTRDSISWVLLVSNALIWGTSFILIKRGLENLSPYQVATLRISAAAIALLPVFVMSLKLLRDKTKLKYILLFGILNGGIPPFLFALAQKEITSSLAGIINSLVPIFTFLIGVLFFKHAFKLNKILGIALGLVGAVLLITFQGDGFEFFSGKNAFALLAILASFLYAVSNHILKEYLQDVPPIKTMSIGFMFMLLPSLAYYALSGGFEVLNSESGLYSFLYIIILGVVGTAFALVLFGTLVQRSSALFASFVTYIIPIIAVLWGIWDGESINQYQIVGMIMIIGGIFLARNIK